MVEQVVELPVDRVTLSEDRAQVTRAGAVSLRAGVTRLSVAGVAPVLSDKTLVARVPDGVSVVDLRVVRTRRILTAERPADVAALEQQLRELSATITAHQQDLALVDGQLKRLDAAARLAFSELSEDASRGKLDVTALSTTVASLGPLEAAARDERVSIQSELAAAERQRLRLRAQLEAVGTPASDCAATLILELSSLSDREATVEVDYIVPGAFWRPYHRARLELPAVDLLGESGARLHFETDGCVWQNTGEDWRDVQLIFSTERPSLGSSPPRLSADVLRAKKTDATVVVESREQAIEVTGLGGGRRKRPEVPGIDDGGQPLSLRARVRSDVPSDGRPHRVPMSDFVAEARVSRVATPELAAAVFLRGETSNGGDGPILAGPVDLIRDSGYVGRTSVLFIAPGETFALGFGPEAGLRVQRGHEEEDEKRAALSSWTTTHHTVTLNLSNLGADAQAVTLTERVPVSEVEKVQIALDKRETTGAPSVDKDGMVRWDVTLQPHGRETVKLGYTVKRHKDVVGL